MSWIEIGKVGKPNALKGGFTLLGATSRDTEFTPGMGIKIGLKEHSLIQATWMPKGWRIQVSDITSPEQANTFRGLTVQIQSQSKETADDFFPAEIVGFTAIELSSGKSIGVLEGIEAMPSGPDRWWFATATGNIFCVPAIKNFVKKVDRKARTIELENIQEFLEL